MDILDYNREAWNHEVEAGNIWTKPVASREIEEAGKGMWSIFLTPAKPVPMEWFPELKSKAVLCLASGGGQQGPILAAVGANVTVFDNCPAQLAQDKMVAERDGLPIDIEQGDMRDLSRFGDERFDLIVHPVSNCFIDDVIRVWKECYRVLKKGGILLAGFINPVSYIFDFDEWENNKSRTVRFSIPYSDTEQLSKEQLKARMEANEPLEFGHSLADLIGGQIQAGFSINGFYEDTSEHSPLHTFVDTFIATRAVK